MNRGGNRRINAILYRIALTQARCSPDAKAYVARRMTEGKSRTEADRALKRYIVRAIWRLWRECQGEQVRERLAAQPAAPSQGSMVDRWAGECNSLFGRR